MAHAHLLQALRSIVGEDHVLVDPGLRAGYERDWTGRFGAPSLAVVRPGTTGEVAAVLGACSAANVPIVTQGGNTGLVGGSVGCGGELILSLRRLHDIAALDATAGQVEVGAGVTLASLQERTAAAGWAFAIDMASRGSATVGGMLATNAGGTRVLRYGPMRAQLLGFEAVLANGQVVRRMSGVRKENAGYDLASLLAGSEGTLAVFTRALLALVPAPTMHAVALLGFESLAPALAALAHVRAAVPSLQSAEFFFADGLRLVCEHSGLTPPFPADPGAFLLLEAAGRRDVSSELFGALGDVAGVLDSAVAVERPDRDRLWAYRERHTEAINAAGVPHKLDTAVPLDRAVAFEQDLRRLAASRPGARLVLFGHLAEGNFHVNLLGLPPGDEALDAAVLELAAAHGGTISSEHGVGRAKARWLPLVRDPADIAAMRALKRSLDPGSILNPGILFPPGPS